MMNSGPAQGVPVFLFPDHAQRAVDIVLRGDNAFHRDNDDLARHLFHLLTHQFPRKWFIVGVGTVQPGQEKEGAVKIRLNGGDVLNGTIPLHFSPSYGNFPFFDGRGGRGAFQRQNGSQLWYIVHAMDPFELDQNGGDERSLAKCKAMKSCVYSLNSICSDHHSDHRPALLAMFRRTAEASIWVPEPLAIDSARMTVMNSVKLCGEADGDEADEDHHVLLVASQRKDE